MILILPHGAPRSQWESRFRFDSCPSDRSNAPIPPLPPRGGRSPPVSAQRNPLPPDELPTFRSVAAVSHAAPTAAAHRIAGCVPGSLRTTPAAPPPRPPEKSRIVLSDFSGTCNLRSCGNNTGRPRSDKGPSHDARMREPNVVADRTPTQFICRTLIIHTTEIAENAECG